MRSKCAGVEKLGLLRCGYGRDVTQLTRLTARKYILHGPVKHCPRKLLAGTYKSKQIFPLEDGSTQKLGTRHQTHWLPWVTCRQNTLAVGFVAHCKLATLTGDNWG